MLSTVNNGTDDTLILLYTADSGMQDIYWHIVLLRAVNVLELLGVRNQKISNWTPSF